MKLRFTRNLQIGYGFSILILLIVGIIAYITLNNLLISNESVAHSNLIIQRLENTISVMKDAETGQRGYLLTNQKEFLEPYNGSYQKAISLINEVKQLTIDNLQQQKNMASLKAILIQRLSILQVVVDKKKNGAVITNADLNSGKLAMDTLRKAVDNAENDERKLLNQRGNTLKAYSFITPIIILIAVLAAVGISVFSYFKVVNDVNEKDRLTYELQKKEEETATFNEELTAANEEINAANEELISINEELLKTQDDLANLNLLLEEKVELRTRALKESEAEAQALNEELTAINEEMAATNEEILSTNEELALSKEKLQISMNDLILTKAIAEKNEKLFKSIAVNIPKSLIVVIGKDHRFITIEGDLKLTMGYHERNYEGKHPVEVLSPEKYEEIKDLYDRVLTGEQFKVENKGSNGEDFQVDFVPLKDEKNEVYAGLIITLDITEMKKAEEKSAKLAAIVESSDDAIISKTLDGIITSWNRSAERIFGYNVNDMVGQSILKLIPEDRHNEEPLIISRLKSGDRVEHFETKRITKDKKNIDVSLTISPIRDSQGLIIGVSKIARDISERKQDDLRKNDFIGMVSHELKTPLTSLTALIQVLNYKLKNNEDSFIPSALGKANLQVKKMSNMINGFLNISRLESGKIMIDKHYFNIKELIREMLEEAELTVSIHKLMFDTGAPTMVNADRDKIGSVISNLISNAVKYSPKGEIITVKCAVIENNVVISVNDEGMGIKADDIEKLFERYYRVNTNHTKHISGFGIGLYLSAEIIERHNGKIWVDSTSGVGSTFYFSLPLETA